MNVDNPLSQQFLIRYPAEAARVLEQLSPGDVAALLSEISANVAAPVLTAMFPIHSAACLGAMDIKEAAKLMNTIPVNNAARIFSLLGQEKQKELSPELAGKHRKRIRRVLNYRTLSAGDLMNPNVDMLLDSMTVADTIRRMERYRQTVKCEIYVVDEDHHFMGVVELGKLLTARRQVQLRDIMSRSIHTVPVHASSESLLGNAVWVGKQRLPVVESDNTLVGILDYERVKESVDKDYIPSRDPLESVFSLASLYWLTMVQLLDSLLNIAATRKGEKL